MTPLSVRGRATSVVRATPAASLTNIASEATVAHAARGYDVMKRAVDIVGAAIGLVVGAPIVGVAALAIRLETKGPAVFRQTRLGQCGKPFTLYKLRGMHWDARERFPELYEYRYVPESIGGLRFHSKNDPRITRVGKYLRQASIDEIPNLWNVLRGEMSLVGPRPEIPEMLQYYRKAASLVLTVKPGVTSLAQVSGRDQLTVSQSVAYDVEYVRSRSFWLDLKILFRTLVTLFRGGWVIN